MYVASAVIVRKLRYLSANTGFRHFSLSCSSSQTRKRMKLPIEIWNRVGVGLPCIPERAWLPPYTGRNSVRKLKVSDIMFVTLAVEFDLTALGWRGSDNRLYFEVQFFYLNQKPSAYNFASWEQLDTENIENIKQPEILEEAATVSQSWNWKWEVINEGACTHTCVLQLPISY